MANSISLEVIAKAIITIGHLLLGLAKSGISMADLNDVYGGKKTWRDIFSPVEPIDTSAVNDAIIAGVITITGMPNSDGWYLGTALCPACGLMVTADIDPGGIVKFSDHGIDGNWCSCQGYDLNIYDPRYKAAARQSCRVEKRPCPRCHKRVDAEIRDPEDPRNREVHILPHEECSYTGDGCEIFTMRCRSCGSEGVKARYDWKGNIWYDHHDVPGGMSCSAPDPIFCDPYHLEGLVGEDSFGTHLIVQDTEP